MPPCLLGARKHPALGFVRKENTTEKEHGLKISELSITQGRDGSAMAPLPSPPRRVGEALSGGCFASLLGCRVFET